MTPPHPPPLCPSHVRAVQACAVLAAVVFRLAQRRGSLLSLLYRRVANDDAAFRACCRPPGLVCGLEPGHYSAEPVAPLAGGVGGSAYGAPLTDAISSTTYAVADGGDVLYAVPMASMQAHGEPDALPGSGVTKTIGYTTMDHAGAWGALGGSLPAGGSAATGPVYAVLADGKPGGAGSADC